MSQDLLGKRLLQDVIGQARLKRLLHAGWLAPAQRNGRAVLFSARDVHAALRRLEREVIPPDRAEVLRVRLSELRNGHPRKASSLKPGPNDIVIDFKTAFNGVPKAQKRRRDAFACTEENEIHSAKGIL